MKQLTAAVIGCGNISKFHFSGLEKAGVTIKYVCDLNEATAAPYAQKYQAKYTADFMEIMADAGVDVVTIATFSGIHKKIALAAIAAGKAIICEKTLAINAADAWEITQAAQKAGTIFYTSYMKRFIPAVEKAKELMPRLGILLNGHFKGYQCWGNLIEYDENLMKAWGIKPGEPTWIKRNMGGGILTCGGSHVLDMMMNFFGRPQRVYATMKEVEHLDFELQATALFETKACPVIFDVMAHPLNKIGFLRDGWEEEFTITGNKGRLQIFSSTWDCPEYKASMLKYYNNETGEETEFRFAPCSPFDRAVAFFCANIAAGKQGEQSTLTGYEVDELIAAIQCSAASHTALNIAWRDQ
jgi:predicted dehydrogenase